MVSAKLSGALRWTAAEEVAVRIGAVRSQLVAAADSDRKNSEAQTKQLRSGLTELDSIRQFIHDGINMCNRQYLDGGSRDAVLQGALEKGLTELEEVRSRLVSTLSQNTKSDAQQPPAAPPVQNRRPPSAPTRPSAVQREIEAKRVQRQLSEQQRKAFLDSKEGQPTVVPTTATSRPSSATSRTPQNAASTRMRPTSATVRSGAADATTNISGRRPSATATPEERKQDSTPAPPPRPTSLKFRPSSAPNARSKSSDTAQSNTAETAETPAADNAWSKYQEWAQSVLHRVQSRRVMQQRPGDQKVDTQASASAPSAAEPTSKTNLTQSIVQGNLRRARPSTAGLTPAGGVTATPGAAQRPQSAKLNPQAQLLREQGNVLFQQKKYRESAEAYSRAIECDPHSETLYCNRAAAFLMMNRFLDALHDSLKAIEFDPTHVKAHWRAAKAHLYLGQSDDARSMYTQAHRLATIPSETEAIEAEMRSVDLVDRCRRALKAKEWQEASRYADQVLEIFPPSGPCSMPWQCLRAESLIHTDAHEACNVLAQMTTDDPQCSDAWYLRAKALFYTGHDETSTSTSLSYLQRARELDSTNRAASLQLCIETFAKLRDEGNSAYSAGRWQDAHTAYTRCLTVDSFNLSLKAIILCNRAAVSIQCERWREALDDINQSITFNPHNAKAYTRRARIHQHHQQLELAIKDLQMAVQLYPSAENQERLTQAIELRNAAQRPKQTQQAPPPQQSNTGGFRYFGFASGAQRPSTAGARRTESSYFNFNSQSGTHTPQQQQTTSARAKSYYEILCIGRNSDERTVVKAYRDAALKWHPDKWASATSEQKLHAENVFKEISVAYNVLKDSAKRRQYDLTTP